MTSHDQEPLRLLLADDDPLLLRGFSQILSQYPEVTLVVTAGSGEEALTALEKHKVDIALLDVSMPGMGGIEAARLIRDRFPDVTAVMLTAFEVAGALTGAAAAGVSGFLTKDMPADEIVSLLKRVRTGVPALSPQATEVLLDSFRAHSQRDFEDESFLKAVRSLPTHLSDIYEALCRGDSNPEIARSQRITINTVRSYVSEIFTLLSCKNRTELAYKAGRIAAVHPPED